MATSTRRPDQSRRRQSRARLAVVSSSRPQTAVGSGLVVPLALKKGSPPKSSARPASVVLGIMSQRWFALFAVVVVSASFWYGVFQLGAAALGLIADQPAEMADTLDKHLPPSE